MAVPQQIQQWIKNTYPSPQLDSEWLHACLTYLQTDRLLPLTPLPPFLLALNNEVLQSDLVDSMAPGTGLPGNANELNDVRLTGKVLVQIVAITEIASSAFNLMGVMQAREERERGVVSIDANAGEEEGEDEGPLQRYPRGMLRFELCDGSTTVSAIEYRSIPQLELGVTALGYKLFLKNPLIRNGVAFLEPACIELVGGHVQDREDNQWWDFRQGLGIRLGQTIDADDAPAPAPAPQIIPAQPPQHQPQQPNRAPFRDMSPPPSPGSSGSVHEHDDDVYAPLRRKVPNPNSNSNHRNAHASGSGSRSGATQSSYFTSQNGSIGTEMEILSRERILSPIGRGTHFPSSPSPPPPQTAHFPGTRPIAHLPKRSISNPKTNSKTTAAKDRAPSSDFDYDFGMDDMAMVMDDAALEELDLIEVKASGSNFVSNSTNSNISVLGSSVSGGGSAYASVSAVGSGSGFGAPSTSISIPPPIQREPTRNVDSNIIVIDSDAEEDKENVPVPTRHVRRRTQQDMTQARGQPRARLDVDVDDDDVIDISSE